MAEYNQSRSWVVQGIFIAVFVIVTIQLLNLQVFSSKYRWLAENNARFRKVLYPDRGIIYDRKQRAILENKIMFDLQVTPSEIRGADTAMLCKILGIDSAQFHKRIIEAIIKNSSVRPSIFEPLLSPELYARLNENMYRFPGFILTERPIRSYPYNTAGNILGYLAEVDTSFLRKHADEGYEMGDYTGMTGLERTYEKVLMGNRGIEYFIRDNRSRIQGRYEGGNYDTTPVAGKNIYLSLDVELQQLGEKLMTNKVGSIVAIDPKTGGIICMVSSPTYNPNYLTGNKRRKHFSELYTDPRLPLLNRTLQTYYSPGSTFKSFIGIVGMAEGVIDDRSVISCGGAYYGCGRRMGCHSVGNFTLKPAIAKSCNTYFAVTFRRTLDNPIYPSIDSALNKFNRYAYSFGLGHTLGVDLPSEKRGNIPVATYYKKIFGKNWKSCNIISNSIGQGEVLTTLTQLSNMMAIIANKGWYYTPHLVDSIEGGDQFGLLEKYKIKHRTLPISDSIFEDVHAGMQATMESGTGFYAKVPGINVCGKTGTVENSYKGEKQKDHAFFGAFAPRENPRIAIAVMCENAGYGATSAAPIASLLIEKYLKDSIEGPKRKAEVERLTNMNLIPPRMLKEMRKIDSVKRSKDSIQLRIRAQQKEVKDTVDIDEKPEFDERKTTPAPGDTTKKEPIAFQNPILWTKEERKKASWNFNHTA